MSERPAAYGSLPRARITRQGQITVPKAVRDALGAAPGDDVVFEPRDGDMVIRVVPRRSILALAGAAAVVPPSIGPGKAEMVEAVERSVVEALSKERNRELGR